MNMLYQCEVILCATFLTGPGLEHDDRRKCR